MTEIRVCARTEVTDAKRVFVALDETEIGVLEYDGQLFAYENRCRHQGGPACEGILLGKVEVLLDADKRARGERFSQETTHIVCPWHGWEYDVRTGRCATDSSVSLRKYNVVERDSDIFLVIPDE
jgi:nitrite reductase/ring-hydroxylating ferredoxin subunit